MEGPNNPLVGKVRLYHVWTRQTPESRHASEKHQESLPRSWHQVIIKKKKWQEREREVGEGKRGGRQGPLLKGCSCSDIADDIFRTLSRSA